MAEARAEVHGYRELVVGSRRVFAKIGDAATDAFGKTAQREADLIKGRMPRASGRMAGSVTASAERRSRTATVGLSKSDAPQAGWVEFGGTRNRPYVPGGRSIFPTALAAEPQLKAAGEKAATDEIRGAIWPTPRT